MSYDKLWKKSHHHGEKFIGSDRNGQLFIALEQSFTLQTKQHWWESTQTMIVRGKRSSFEICICSAKKREKRVCWLHGAYLLLKDGMMGLLCWSNARQIWKVTKKTAACETFDQKDWLTNWLMMTSSAPSTHKYIHIKSELFCLWDNKAFTLTVA